MDCCRIRRIRSQMMRRSWWLLKSPHEEIEGSPSKECTGPGSGRQPKSCKQSMLGFREVLRPHGRPMAPLPTTVSRYVKSSCSKISYYHTHNRYLLPRAYIWGRKVSNTPFRTREKISNNEEYNVYRLRERTRKSGKRFTYLKLLQWYGAFDWTNRNGRETCRAPTVARLQLPFGDGTLSGKWYVLFIFC